MTQPFVPHQPEKFINVKISIREASLLQKLRKCAYGEFTIMKQYGLIMRVKIIDSQTINGDDEIDLSQFTDV